MKKKIPIPFNSNFLFIQFIKNTLSEEKKFNYDQHKKKLIEKNFY